MRVLNGAVADVNGAKAVLNGAIIVLNGAMTSSQLKDSCSPRSGSIFDKAMSVFKQSSNGAICANFQRSEGLFNELITVFSGTPSVFNGTITVKTLPTEFRVLSTERCWKITK